MFSRNLTIIREFCLITAVAIGILQSSNHCVFAAPAKSSAQVNYKPTKEDLAHGKTQTEHMLNDLPAMRQWLTKDNPFYDFAVNHYAADATGRRIYWIPFEENGWETASCNANSVTAKDDTCGRISIRKVDYATGKPLSPESLWTALVFESFNTWHGHRFNKIKLDAISGKLSREQFIIKSAEDEYLNAKETNRFYLSKVIPWSKRNQKSTNGFHWYQNIPPTFEQDMKYFQDKTKYPWSFFGTYYDNFIVKERKKNRVNL